MDLANLVDLECQIHQDPVTDPVERRQRDRTIGKSYNGDPEDRESLLLHWLSKMRKAGDPSVGERLEKAFRILHIGLVVGGLLIGMITAKAVLAFDGKTPVNVPGFLFYFVALHALLLVLLLLTFLPERIRKWLPLVGDLQVALAWLGGVIAKGLGKISSDQKASMEASMGLLKSRRGLYGRLQAWTLLGMTQSFAVAFNASALVTCFYLFLTADFPFAWSTTFGWGVDYFHSLTKTIAAPWAWIFPDGVPSHKLVVFSEYDRLNSKYVHFEGRARVTDIKLVREWWLFLMLSLFTYGFLPRFVALVIARWRAYACLSTVRLDAGHFQALLDRMTTQIPTLHSERRKAAPQDPLPAGALLDKDNKPAIESSEDAAHDRAQAPAPKEEDAVPPAVADGCRPCSLIIWRDLNIPADTLSGLLKEWLALDIQSTLHAGGIDMDIQRQTLESLKSQQDIDDAVVVVAEGDSPPRKAVRRFLKEVRAAVSETRPIVVALVQHRGNEWVLPSEDDRKYWLEAVTTLGDPFLRLEAMGAQG